MMKVDIGHSMTGKFSGELEYSSRPRNVLADNPLKKQLDKKTIYTKISKNN